MSLKSFRREWQKRDHDDPVVFADALTGVAKLPEVPEPPSPPKPKARALKSEADERAVLDELKFGSLEASDHDGSDLLEFLAPGYSPKLLKKLKRGQFAFVDEIDLHHLSRVQALELLKLFLKDLRTTKPVCVRIVHGKGTRSGIEGPVIKPMVDGHLRQRNDVIAFASLKPQDGGTGAVAVLLKPR
jgi:DNA-nicking Smr family endonuclease